MSKPGLPKWMILVGSLIYIFSPVDLIPEAVLGPFGLADDAIVALMGFRALFQPQQ